MTAPQPAEGASEVLAAGGVVWRRTASAVEIAVVHRPKYDDWSHPKGKLDDGEGFEEAALREVQEETGCEGRLGTLLGDVTYLHEGHPKRVRYWAIEVEPVPFRPTNEVDEVRWLEPSAARRLLSYGRDRELVDAWTRTVGA